MWDVKPEDLVVCVNDSATHDTIGHTYKPLEVNQIYSVREVVPHWEWWMKIRGVGLRLHEIRRGCDGKKGEIPFIVSRFRPVRKTDISELEKLLSPVDA